MTPPPDAPYTMRALRQMLGLSRGVIVRLIEARYVVPVRGSRNEYRFSFQDVVALRTAHELRHARVPHRRLLHSLRQLRERLPPALPTSGLRIKAVGDQVAVLSGDAAWDPGSGQLLLDFDVTGGREATPVLRFHRRGDTAAEWHRQGELLEESDPHAAEAAYRQALRLDPAYTPGYIDLGALLCHVGRCAEAVELYQRALAALPADAHLHFNAAIALEDQGRLDDALRQYEQALALDGQLADAHFNAARLCERLGNTQGAVRHFSAYRRLARLAGEPAPDET